MEKILIVDDDEILCMSVSDDLALEGYDMVSAGDGLTGLRSLQSENFDLLILDLVLPSISGFELLQRVRKLNLSLPVIILSALKDNSEIRKALTLGADEYVTKPFIRKEFLTRISQIFRREKILSYAPALIEVGKLKFNPGNQFIQSNGKKVYLGFLETFLFYDFYLNRNLMRTAKEIMQAVWGDEIIVPQWIFDIYIDLLRAKIELSPTSSNIRVTYGSTGYMLQADFESTG